MVPNSLGYHCDFWFAQILCLTISKRFKATAQKQISGKRNNLQEKKSYWARSGAGRAVRAGPAQHGAARRSTARGSGPRGGFELGR